MENQETRAQEAAATSSNRLGGVRILVRDLGTGLRMLRRRPATPFVVWLSLTLAIGAAATIFSVVNTLLLQPPPYRASDRLVYAWASDPNQSNYAVSTGTFEDWRRQARSFESLAALLPTAFSLTAQELPETPFSRGVTANYFSLFGVEPILGRVFSEQEVRDDFRGVILSRSLWQRQFGGDPSIVGRRVELDYEPWEVIGVMEFLSPLEPSPVQMWVPLALPPELINRRYRRLAVWGRLAPDVSRQDAEQELNRLIDEARDRDPALAGREARIHGVREMMMGRFKPAVLTLFGAGCLLVLIVCGNAAHLLLDRARRRQREIAVRSTLGAERVDMLRQLLSEHLILFLAAAGAAVAVASLGIGWLQSVIPMRFGLPHLDGVRIDGWVLLFTFGIALVTAFVLGLVFNRLVRRQLAAEPEVAHARSTTARRVHLLRDGFVVLMLAGTLVLLVGSGLVVQSLLSVRRHEVGRDPRQVLTLRTSLRGAGYRDPARRIGFYQQAQEVIAALPEVEAAGATDLIPLINPRQGTRFSVPGMTTIASEPTASEPTASEPRALLQIVTPTYFEALGVALISGRAFDHQDTVEAPRVAIVNGLFAARYLGNQPPLGQHLELADGSAEVRRIVGVVDDLRAFDNPPEPEPAIYLPHAQRPAGTMSWIVRTRSDPEALAPEVQTAIGQLDRMPSVYRFRSLARCRAEADWQSRFITVLLGLFAAVALIQALTGIHAVIAAGAWERQRELAVRMAYGAHSGLVLAVWGRALVLTAVGIGLGLVASLILSPLVAGQLHGIGARDPLTYVAVALLLAGLLLAVSWVPARRVLKAAPAGRLRED
ncbi:MAG: ABC transporter permease [bacterium]|nr:ABC transporter permease [bacterium]